MKNVSSDRWRWARAQEAAEQSLRYAGRTHGERRAIALANVRQIIDYLATDGAPPEVVAELEKSLEWFGL